MSGKRLGFDFNRLILNENGLFLIIHEQCFAQKDSFFNQGPFATSKNCFHLTTFFFLPFKTGSISLTFLLFMERIR